MTQQLTTKTKTTMNNVQQVGGTHYNQQIQPWDEFKRLNVSWAQGEISKYLCRWPKKGGVQDLEKALSIVKKFQVPIARKEQRFISYYPEFLEQYREMYGPKYEDFVFCMKRTLREEWYMVEPVLKGLIEYYKNHKPYEKEG